MALARDEAWKLLTEWTETESLRTHARAVELVMRRAAHAQGAAAEEEVWGIAGMLHDADYEKWPDTHPQKTVAWLEERGEHALARAVSAHYTRWNVPYETLMEKALVASDELTGFVVACCLVRPDGVETLTPQSVMKKLKSKTFAASVDREEVRQGAALLGVELADQIQLVIDALKPHAVELGIQGKGASGTK